MEKNTIVAGIISLGFVLGIFILSSAIKNRNQSENTILVTGLGTKKFTSDLAVWSGSFYRESSELNTAYAELKNDKLVIEKYLLSKGIKAKEMVFSAVNIQKKYEYVAMPNGHTKDVFVGYTLSQKVTIENKNIQSIDDLSRNITEIINQGIEFTSESPRYYYTKLADLKQQMIADATKDAKQRAEKIAENGGGSLGSLKKATMGVFQITAPNSDEEYSYGGTFNTTSKEKEANITIKLEYQID